MYLFYNFILPLGKVSCDKVAIPSLLCIQDSSRGNAVITVKHILIECAYLLEVRKKYFEEKSLYSLFRNVIPEIFFDFLQEI